MDAPNTPDLKQHHDAHLVTWREARHDETSVAGAALGFQTSVGGFHDADDDNPTPLSDILARICLMMA